MRIAGTAGIDTTMAPQLGEGAFAARQRLVLQAGGSRRRRGPRPRSGSGCASTSRWGEDEVLRRAAELGVLSSTRWGDLYPKVLFPTAVALRDELSSVDTSAGTASDLAAACDAALCGEIVRALSRIAAVLTAADAARFPKAKPLAREILRGSARSLTTQKAWLSGTAAKRALHAAEDTPERIGAVRREISWML